jgi:hypothetical protein
MILPTACFDRGCVHYIGVRQPDGTEKTERVVCKAYPEGIPDDIADGIDLHSKVRKDQKNSFVFKKGQS